MRYLVIVMMLWCGTCWADYYQIDGITFDSLSDYNKYRAEKLRQEHIQETLDKIYSMVADLEIKFMGQERYQQIYDPENEGEVAKQKKYTADTLEMIYENGVRIK